MTGGLSKVTKSIKSIIEDDDDPIIDKEYFDNAKELVENEIRTKEENRRYRETKTSLIYQLGCKHTDWYNSHTKLVINEFLSLMIEKIVQGKEVEIRGLGVFYFIETKERTRINPHEPGSKFLQPPQTLLRLKVSKEIKEAINADRAQRED